LTEDYGFRNDLLVALVGAVRGVLMLYWRLGNDGELLWISFYSSGFLWMVMRVYKHNEE